MASTNAGQDQTNAKATNAPKETNEIKNTDTAAITAAVEKSGIQKHNNNDKHEDGSHTPERTHIDEELLKPLWIATMITHHPCKMCWGIIVFMMLLAVIDSLAFALSDTSSRTWFVEESETVQDYDTWTLAEEALSNHGGSDFKTDPQTEEVSLLTAYWMFELNTKTSDASADTDYWILTPDNLKLILEYEESITQDQEWIDAYCYVTNTTTYDCEYTSIARDVAAHWDYDYENMTTEGIKEYVLDLFYYTSDTPGTIESSFNEDFAETNQTYLYRSFLLTGLPIAQKINYTYDDNGTVIAVSKTSEYINDNDEYEEQEEEVNEYYYDFWVDITVDHNAELEDGDLRVVFFQFIVYQDYFNSLLLQSMVWVIAAIVCVCIWVTVHLQSLILSSLALLQIILSFPFAYFIYRYILQITQFDTLSLLIIFVLLGVGADDVFVFTDAWRQSVHFVRNPNSLLERMTFSYRRAVKAMLVTQTTTFCAFLATSFSKIMPISAFGIWAALIVACNYVLVITLYPSLVLVHYHYIQGFERKYCCCCCKSCQEEDKKAGAGKDGKKNENTSDLFTNEIELGDKKKTDDKEEQLDSAIPPNLERQKSVEEQSVNYGRLERFFALTWAVWITKARIPILVVFAILFGVVVWRATQLEEQNEDEAFFEEDHFMQQVDSLQNEYTASETSGLVYVPIIWGAKGVDRDGSDYWDPTDYGSIKWDSSFDMSSAKSQEWLYNASIDLSQSDLAFQESSVISPMTYFKQYLENIGESFPYVYASNITEDDSDYDEDLQSEMFAEIMYNFTQSSYALYANAYSLIFVEPAADRDDGLPYVRYIAIATFTSNPWSASLTEGREFEDDFNDWLDSTFRENDNCPDGLTNPKASSYRWCWMVTNREFILSAFQGIAIALPLAFVVLLLSTQNWMLAIFATMDIVGVMMCELGIMEMMGWQFGVSESIAIVIVIGFSVDYVVHLANAYLECPSGVRSERISFALLTMGISVTSGAITTLLAGICLLFPEVVFFFKMGILIVTTILFSLAWSMLFFIAVLATAGPQFEKGHIPFEKIPFYKTKEAMPCCKKSDV